MAEQPQEYVVVTRYQKSVYARPIVHTYGPYTQSKAKSVKSNMRAEAQRLGHSEKLEVNACHIIDVDRMNQEQAAAVVREQMK